MVNSNGKFQNKRPVIVGDTADVHLQRALTILRNENINPTVSIELAPKNNGVFCGREEVATLLKEILLEIIMLSSGMHPYQYPTS